MIKRILIFLVVITCLSGIFYSLYHFRKIKQPISDPYLSVPTSAAIIMDIKNGHELWEELANTNIMWEALMSTETFSQLNQSLVLLDTLYTNFSVVREIIDNQSILISAHMTGALNYHFITTFSLPAGIDKENALSYIQEISKGLINLSKKEFEGEEIYTVLPLGYCFSIHNSTFSGSYSLSLVEESIKQANSDKSIRVDESFQNIVSTSGKNQKINVYVNQSQIHNILKTFASPEVEPFFLWLKTFSQWTELDFKLRANYLMLNGFSVASDSTNNYLSVFEGQKPQKITLPAILPQNTAFISELLVSNPIQYFERHKAQLQKLGIYANRKEKTDQFNDSLKTNIEEEVLSWFGNQAALVITEVADSNEVSKNTFAVIHFQNIDSLTFSLEKLNTKSGLRTKPDTLRYRNHLITKITLPPFLHLVFGDIFSSSFPSYFCVIEDFVVFSNEIDGLKSFISDYTSGRTMNNDKNYEQYATKHLYEESNLFIYANFSQSLDLFKSYASEKSIADIQLHADLFSKFQAISFQMSADKNGLFYNNLALKYNPISKKELTTLWETSLQSSLNTKPQLPINHYTNNQEVFVQDESNNLYLISNTGKLLWTRALEEQIVGQVNQIDIYGNNKLQLLFNTASKLYLIDRNGKDVEGYPVTLSAKATTMHTLLDYDNDKNYRILIPCEDNRIYNYDKVGKPVKGWIKKDLNGILKTPIQYFKIGTKDYIMGITTKGDVFILDRKGENRVSIKSNFSVSENNSFFIETGKDLSKTRIISTDSTGNILSLFLDDKITSNTIQIFSKNHFFAFEDITGDFSGEYIFVDDTTLFVYSQDNTLLLNYSFNSTITLAPQVFNFGGEKRIGITSTETNELFLFDEKGNIVPSFPLSGNTLFSVGDINKDGNYNLIVGGKNNTVYVYAIEER